MVPSIRNKNNLYHASHCRASDWQKCCAKTMGFEDWTLVDVVAASDDDHKNDPSEFANNYCVSHTNVQITNLLPSELFEDDNDDDNDDDQTDDNHRQPAKRQKQQATTLADPWTENALNIQADLERMANWIQSKKWSFISFDAMRDDEASLVQSTVTSFAATTANEIESLRKMTSTSESSASSSNELINHRTGIVQILLARLKEDIVEPFGILQKHRSRKAVSLWQNPLQCKLLVKTRSKGRKRKQPDDLLLDQALGLDDSAADNDYDEVERLRREQRFLPSRDSHKLRSNFMETYQQDEHLTTSTMLKRPKSLIREPMAVLSSENEMVYNSNNNNKNQQPERLHIGGGQVINYSTASGTDNFEYRNNMMSPEEMSEEAHHQMQQEALLLEAMVHSDLDSVQKMESQMVLITNLLTQFSELVSEQQEEVWQIHDTAKETKENMDKGQESLVDAAERTHQSKHYMAKTIFAMGCLLLLFHWLRP